MQKPLVPFEEKLHAIAYVNSNCGAQSGRSEIMRKLIAMGDKAKVCVRARCLCRVRTLSVNSLQAEAAARGNVAAAQRRPCLHATEATS